MTKKNLIKSLAFLPVVAGTIAMTPAPAAAFWNLFGPSHQQVCETILPDVEKYLPEHMKKWGQHAATSGAYRYSSTAGKRLFWTWVKPDELQYSGNVTAVKIHRDIELAGYKPVTGCITQFTYKDETFILKYSVELDDQSGKYYYSTIPPTPLD